MSDLDKLFENAPEGAVELREHEQVGLLRWFDKEGKAWCGENWFVSEFKKWSTIATRPRPEPGRKTVEDAVEWAKGEWGGDSFTHMKCRNSVLFYASGDYLGADGCSYLVCTREQFEACVAAKVKSEPHFKATRENLEKIAKDAKGEFVEVSEPEWTHKYGSDNCYIKVAEPDKEGCIVIVTEESGYIVCRLEDPRPIKPTITKAEHEFLCKFSADVNDIHITSAVESYLAEREVVK